MNVNHEYGVLKAVWLISSNIYDISSLVSATEDKNICIYTHYLFENGKRSFAVKDNLRCVPFTI